MIDYRVEANETNLIAFLVINENIATNNLYRDVVTLNEKNAYYQPEENINLLCLVNEIPKTYTGKFKRHELRKLKIWNEITQMLHDNKKKYDLVIDMREGNVSVS